LCINFDSWLGVGFLLLFACFFFGSSVVYSVKLGLFLLFSAYFGNW